MSHTAPTLFDFDNEDFFPKEAATPPVSGKKGERKNTEADAPEPGNIPDAAGEMPGGPDTSSPESTEEALSPESVHPDLPGKQALSDAREAFVDNLDAQLMQEIAADYASLHLHHSFDPGRVEFVGGKQKAASVEIKEKEAPVLPEERPPDTETQQALPEWKLDKNYYSIGAVAQMFGVNISHIRFWTTEFKIKPRTTRKGDRLYNPEQIAQLRLIHHLVKEKKHTLKGAKEVLKSGKEAVAHPLDLRDSLLHLQELLLEMRESL